MTTTWSHVLDALAAHLDAQAEAICDGDLSAITAFVPPADLGSLTSADAPRARELLGEAAALEDVVSISLAAAGRELAAVRRSVPAAPAASRPSFVDERA